MVSRCSTCFRKSGPMPGCKRGDQEKPRPTPSGPEKGHWFLNINLVDVTLTAFCSVFQMSLLEVEEIGEGTPQGVALFLVGSDPESGKEQECTRTLRMYNLASLISLARYAISQKVRRPLFIGAPSLRDHLGRRAIGSPQTPWLASTSVDIKEAKASWQPSKGPKITHVRSTARPRASIILSNNASDFARSFPEGRFQAPHYRTPIYTRLELGCCG